jgi:RHH-type proline utilization regulon transcriptional repressor/proline dehydrogenase/delta 1-pyrroline-5-carboxylate dehydrogenase
VIEATPAVTDSALAQAGPAAESWAATPPGARAAVLDRAADLLEARMPALLGPIVREAGKTLPNAVGEVREAVDFLRYYAAQARGFAAATHRPLGAVACISPWNFPLAIFTGQVAAALAAGNAVLAKPAEETPLIAAAATAILHEAGVPRGALQLLPGDGRVGARLVADPRVRGVLFTGSLEVARRIAASLAERLNPDGTPVPLIAETGGQNALIVDSSALPEQVVADVLASAFDSAGQRCSALRVLCLQQEIADRVLAMLRGAMAELAVGDPARLETDVGPVITAEARAGILAHIAAMRAKGRRIHALPLGDSCAEGTFVAPTLIEIDRVAELTREVFGPVLHVIRFRREGLDGLLRDIAATGYGLTFGVHSRLDAAVERITARAAAGNLYVNRNLIGAVVGVQPFGGHRLSGTGPKAGGPLYLRRLLAACPAEPPLPATQPPPEAVAFLEWVRERHPDAAETAARQVAASRLGLDLELPGAVGEANRYSLHPRGTVLCQATTRRGLLLQIAACLSTGNVARVTPSPLAPAVLEGLPASLAGRVATAGSTDAAACDGTLFEGETDALRPLVRAAAAADGPIRPVLALMPADIAAGRLYPPDMLLAERSISINTAAAGGNASLMSL